MNIYAQDDLISLKQQGHSLFFVFESPALLLMVPSDWIPPGSVSQPLTDGGRGSLRK